RRARAARRNARSPRTRARRRRRASAAGCGTAAPRGSRAASRRECAAAPRSAARARAARAGGSRLFPTIALATAASGLALVPVEDLLSGAHHDLLARKDVLVELLEVRDAVRRAGDVGMHADRHHARNPAAFAPQPVEGIGAAPQPLVRRMVLNLH